MKTIILDIYLMYGMRKPFIDVIVVKRNQRRNRDAEMVFMT